MVVKIAIVRSPKPTLLANLRKDLTTVLATAATQLVEDLSAELKANIGKGLRG